MSRRGWTRRRQELHAARGSADAQRDTPSCLEDSYLQAIVAEGGEAFGKSAYMPSFKTTLSSQDIADVIAYVRTFPLY